MTTENLENLYKDTIDLPQTEFPMRGNGPVREPEIQKSWQEKNIYQKSQELRQKESAKLFVLHDGPPYLSSDKIHIGTALNKILKDIVIKYKALKGFKAPYVPGYDSHGLPIENAVVQEIKGGRSAVTVAELRERCKNFALNNLKGQEEKFKRLGVLGDWQHPYVTLDKGFEAEQIKLFGEMSAKGYIYRGLKTVYWSYGAETALADAEVEYNEEHVSNSIYVAFDLDTNSVQKLPSTGLDLNQTRILIWTTTPWTIPGNMAICLNTDIDYITVEAYRIKENEKISLGKLLIAKDLKDSVARDLKLELENPSAPVKGSSLAGLVAIHPLFKRPSPIIFGEHVTIDTGTGCVHTAPGHGHEDFEIGKKFNIEIVCPVDGRGVYTKQAGSYKFKNPDILNSFSEKNESLKQKLANLNNPQELNLEGFHVIKQGNDLLISMLIDAGALIGKNKITHSYPYCWRSKTPLLYRATEQWFASVDGFRQKALEEIDKVNWIPERGRNRIYSMVAERGDWCISRQRTWGVPIPAFYNKAKLNDNGNPEAILDQEIIEHIAKIFREHGSNAWYLMDVRDLVPESFLTKHPEIKIENLVKEMDTMDVWFDSGSTHRTVVMQRPELCPDGKFHPVDLYLEGSDQHRGWFQSSLLTSVATNGKAPYKAVLTHGFVMDEKGRKMSKSLGNVVDPIQVMDSYGADILRLWVASVDYSIDIKVGENMFKQLSDIYRNFRNTARYMLGNLFDFDPQFNYVAYDQLWELDKLLLHKLQELIGKLEECFDNYQFFKYYQLIQNFCSVDLSSFYFDIIKDRLYTHGTNSLSRRSAQTVCYELLSAINRMLVPVLPHLAEDIFNYSPASIKDSYLADKNFFQSHVELYSASILLSNWPKIKTEYINSDLVCDWTRILELRELCNKEIETLRQEKIIGKSLEAGVAITAIDTDYKLLKRIEGEIKAVFIISDLSLKLGESLIVKAYKFDGVKCIRCWKLFEESEIHNHICKQCKTAISG
ncbi:MAG: hypothetical protein RLZZ361_829 [Cyanobacteriota bacterium]|jgi:isoleucyl-tRNA synthetase